MSATILAVLAYIGLIIILLVAIAAYRTGLVVNKTKTSNGFSADGSDVTPFGQRLTRVHANAIESFPFTCGLMLLALATNSAAVTDGLALWLLVARIGQAIVHLVSTSVVAVQIRFVFFLAQIAICSYWVWLLAVKFI
jgi:uncharacterized MAPEG superfamily protein